MLCATLLTSWLPQSTMLEAATVKPIAKSVKIRKIARNLIVFIMVSRGVSIFDYPMRRKISSFYLSRYEIRQMMLVISR